MAVDHAPGRLQDCLCRLRTAPLTGVWDAPARITPPLADCRLCQRPPRPSLRSGACHPPAVAVGWVLRTHAHWRSCTWKAHATRHRVHAGSRGCRVAVGWVLCTHAHWRSCTWKAHATRRRVHAGSRGCTAPTLLAHWRSCTWKAHATRHRVHAGSRGCRAPTLLARGRASRQSSSVAPWPGPTACWPGRLRPRRPAWPNNTRSCPG